MSFCCVNLTGLLNTYFVKAILFSISKNIYCPVMQQRDQLAENLPSNPFRWMWCCREMQGATLHKIPFFSQTLKSVQTGLQNKDEEKLCITLCNSSNKKQKQILWLCYPFYYQNIWKYLLFKCWNFQSFAECNDSLKREWLWGAWRQLTLWLHETTTV